MNDIYELLEIENEEIIVVCGCSSKRTKCSGDGCC